MLNFCSRQYNYLAINLPCGKLSQKTEFYCFLQPERKEGEFFFAFSPNSCFLFLQYLNKLCCLWYTGNDMIVAMVIRTADLRIISCFIFDNQFIGLNICWGFSGQIKDR